MTRSVSTDITLEPGTYTVFVRVKATQFSNPPPEDVIREKASKQREKLVQIGHSYDLAHAKGVELESEEEEAERKKREKEKKAALKKQERGRAEAQLRKGWKRDKKIAARENRKAKRAARATEQRAAKLQAKNDKELKEGGNKVGQVVEGDAERTDGSNREGDEEATETPRAVNLENKNEGLTPRTGDANGKLEGKATENNDKDMESSEVPNQGKEVRAEEDNKMKGEDLKPSTEDAKGKEVQKGEDPEREDEGNIESHPDSENANDKEKREIEMSTTSKLTKGTENEKQRHGHPGMPEENTESLPELSQKLETDSDTDSGSVFEFDSEIDMSPTEESESDSEEHEKDDDDNNDGEYSVKPPWNAVCVVGLRVCSKDRDLTISIVKPKPWQEHIEVRRDCDDPAVE